MGDFSEIVEMPECPLRGFYFDGVTGSSRTGSHRRYCVRPWPAEHTQNHRPGPWRNTLNPPETYVPSDFLCQ